MNKTFRLIWSIAREAWVVVAENVTSKGGIPARTLQASLTPSALPNPSRPPLVRGGDHRWRLKGFPPDKGGLRGVAFAFALLALAGNAHALPQGGQVAGGSSAIDDPVAGQMTITQTSNKSIINWQSYGIAAGEKVQYIQPGSGSVSLNRVAGVDPSVIHGQLSANGNVWVINPNGLLIGSGARIDVGGFLGSTLNIGDEDFMNGNHRFFADRPTPGSISNLGSITTADGGYVMLIAPTITNEGTITSNLGKAYLASGNDVTLNFAGNNLIGFSVDKGVVSGQTAGISNSGTISAHGGEVILSAKSVNDLLKSVVNNDGVIEARTVDNKNGRILLLGDMQSGEANVAGKLTAHFVETSAATVNLDAGLKVDTQGGEWLIDPVNITIDTGKASAIRTALDSGDVTVSTARTARLGAIPHRPTARARTRATSPSPQASPGAPTS